VLPSSRTSLTSRRGRLADSYGPAFGVRQSSGASDLDWPRTGVFPLTPHIFAIWWRGLPGGCVTRGFAESVDGRVARRTIAGVSPAPLSQCATLVDLQS